LTNREWLDYDESESNDIMTCKTGLTYNIWIYKRIKYCT
jgi:hypothetical protein